MPALSRYIIFQITWPLGFFILSLTGVVWLTQSLRLLDIIIAKGQSAVTYIAFTGLVLPSIATLTMPIAFFCAVLYALNRLSGDHELVVLSAAGQSAWGITRPLLLLSGAVAAVVYFISLWIMPAANTRLKDQVMEIRADLAATLLKEGAFSNPIQGLTVYIREREAGGDMQGILVHDNRDLTNPITYMAERGALVKSPTGPRLIMINGNVQRRDADGGKLSLLYFERYVYDLSEFMPGQGERWKEPKERYLKELLFPNSSAGDQAHLGELRAEAHRRLSSPLYIFAFPLVAMAFLLTGQFSRRTPFLRLGAALAAAIVIRLAGIGLENLVELSPWLLPGLYLWPIIVVGTCLFVLSDEGQRRLSRGRAPISPHHSQVTG